MQPQLDHFKMLRLQFYHVALRQCAWQQQQRSLSARPFLLLFDNSSPKQKTRLEIAPHWLNVSLSILNISLFPRSIIHRLRNCGWQVASTRRWLASSSSPEEKTRKKLQKKAENAKLVINKARKQLKRARNSLRILMNNRSRRQYQHTKTFIQFQISWRLQDWHPRRFSAI